MALLKIGYLLMFKKFGYLFIFNEPYRRIRNQLQEAESILYPPNGWWSITNKKILEEVDNVVYVQENDIKCFYITFCLKTGNSTSYFDIMLPCDLEIFYILKAMDERRYSPISIEELRPYLGFKFRRNFRLLMNNLDYNDSDLSNLSRTKELLTQML